MTVLNMVVVPFVVVVFHYKRCNFDEKRKALVRFYKGLLQTSEVVDSTGDTDFARVIHAEVLAALSTVLKADVRTMTNVFVASLVLDLVFHDNSFRCGFIITHAGFAKKE